ncbi:MAG TPA: hypothetical protein VN238_09595, partial [Solirubrobacteraceae bacterium]|nr:hypothetical protein [Solirubrobacteraceae bacterium]
AAVRGGWARFVGWCGGSHPVARTAGAATAAAIPVVSILLALGVITPFADENALAASQAKTLEAGTSRMRIDVSTGGAAPLRYTATGTFDFREERGTFLYNLSQMRQFEGGAAVEARFFQNAVYLRLPEPPAPRKPWLLVDLVEDPPNRQLLRERDGAGGSPLAEVPSVRVEDPTAVLAAMARSGDVEDLGDVRELGLDVRKYRGRLGGGQTVATAWIGGEDLVRRLQLRDAGRRSTTTMSFYDFGVDVTTEPPPGDDVVVLADVLGRELRAG